MYPAIASIFISVAIMFLLTRAPSPFSLMLLPFYFLGVLASGNVHQPNEAVVFGSMFIVFFPLCCLVLAAFSKLWKRSDRR